jgi:hypothetical protein
MNTTNMKKGEFFTSYYDVTGEHHQYHIAKIVDRKLTVARRVDVVR